MPSRRKSSACTDYVPAICTHRPSLLPIGCRIELTRGLDAKASYIHAEPKQYFSARGSKSRNKVAVGEPAAGSFTIVGYQCKEKRKGREKDLSGSGLGMDFGNYYGLINDKLKTHI